jgi:hypothetical protein
MTNTDATKEQARKLLLACGVLGPLLFIFMVLMEGAGRADYNALQYPLSSLALGDKGWTQEVNFLVTGILIVLFSGPLNQIYLHPENKYYGPLLIGLCGLGLIGAGIFVTDPVYGYPPSSPMHLSQFSFHGHMHDGFSMLFFVCLPWACFLFRNRFRAEDHRRMAAYSGFSAYLMIGAFVLAAMGFKQVPVLVSYAGIFQRISVFSGLTWIAVLALYFLFSVPRPGGEEGDKR